MRQVESRGNYHLIKWPSDGGMPHAQQRLMANVRDYTK